MPSSTDPYDVLLDFTNDTRDCVTVQTQRDYGRHTGAIVLLHPGETVSLILDAGAVYQYTIKTRSKVANVTARSWRDVQCEVSKVFPAPSQLRPAPPSSSPPSPFSAPSSAMSPVTGITVDRHFREMRFCVYTGFDGPTA